MAKHQYALVTGATSGIGLELAKQLAAEGRCLVLVGRNSAKLAAVAEQLTGAPLVHCITEDLAKPGAAEKIAQHVRALGIEVGTLVNNAGFGYNVAFAKSDPARQRALVQVNDMALMELCLAFLPGMLERRSGEVLNVASIAGFMPGPYMATYYASKAFVQSLSQALRIEAKPFGVHVTALCPGPVATAFWETANAEHTSLAAATMDAPTVARIALRDLRRNKALSIPGIAAKSTVLGARVLPSGLIARLAARLQKP